MSDHQAALSDHRAVRPEGSAEQVYAAKLAEGRFDIQRCESCGRAFFYPRELCPHCGSGEVAWFTPSGRGEVYATTTVRRKAEAGGDYNVALIDLEEGPRLMSRVEGLAPEAVRIGLPVRARVLVDDGRGVLLFDAEDTQSTRRAPDE